MNELTETLFYNFLTTESKELDALYESRDALDIETLRAGFYAGYAAAQKVQRAKIRLAMQNIQRAQRTA